MGRTRLYGLELAGIRVAVEAPSGFGWGTTSEDRGRMHCAPHDATVYAGVRVAVPTVPHFDSFLYRSEGRTFEIGSHGGDTVVAIHGRHRCERLARFDPDFSHGEITVHPEVAARLAIEDKDPLAHPLDEILVLHRLIRENGLVLRGSAVLRSARAMVFCGDEEGLELPRPLDAKPGWRRLTQAPTGPERVALRITDDVVRVVQAPWQDASSGAPSRARVDAIQIVEPATAVFSEPLSEDEAVEALLGQIYAPVHDAELADRVAHIAETMARKVQVHRLGLPQEQRTLPFTWGRRHAALAFAPPPPS